ncbi:MAG TPA: YlbF family regulator [Verrucomicrobiae bacterium]|nr:YlbF family regulator [Verrucomicrobiae bacterium]
MQTQTEPSLVTQKTRELCQSILDQPEVQTIRRQVEAFMANDKLRGQYDALMVKGQTLQQKQQAGMPMDGAEITAFEQLRESFLNNPVAKGFLDAQEDMQKMQQSVAEYVSKTFELGRVPEDSDLDSGSCGHGCGCHH